MDQNINLRLKDNITVVTCPEELKESSNTIFLAGGISNCPNWQHDLIDLLRQIPAILLNPRRTSFNIADPSATDFQIAWEHRHLHLAEKISFWFPKETECPITLFELGFWLLSEKPLAVGIHDQYLRIQEIFAILSLHRPELKIVGSLPELATAIVHADGSDLPEKENPKLGTEIFLAGGISDCPDWQTDISQTLLKSGHQVFNPRSEIFAGKGGYQYREHLRNNHQHFINSKAIVFWFPKESFSVMALFELGIACQLKKPIFIGVESGYPREQDIRVQVGLARPEIRIQSSLQDLLSEINLTD